MRCPTAAALLDVWESGLAKTSVDRLLVLLAAAHPEEPAKALAELSIGERDGRLLRMREALFGSRLPNTTRCPACSERLEWESDVADLFVRSPALTGDPVTVSQDTAESIQPTSRRSELELAAEGCRITFRLPNSDDMIALSGQFDVEQARNQLLERCVIAASATDGAPLQLADLPQATLEGLVREMERSDPQANLQIDMTCSACGHSWQVAFDIGSFLWAEIDAWAKRTLRAVDVLARTYGWREAEVLNMSPTRRQIYLEMASQ
mgnify:CR=1 FL=1